MSRASGITPEAERIVLEKPAGVEIAIPDVCVMEAHKALAAMQASKRSFRNGFDIQIDDVRRDPGDNAQRFVRSLLAADLALVNYLDECQQTATSSNRRCIEYIANHRSKCRCAIADYHLCFGPDR